MIVRVFGEKYSITVRKNESTWLGRPSSGQ
jgi:hypothetical protein